MFSLVLEDTFLQKEFGCYQKKTLFSFWKKPQKETILFFRIIEQGDFENWIFGVKPASKGFEFFIARTGTTVLSKEQLTNLEPQLKLLTSKLSGYIIQFSAQ